VDSREALIALNLVPEIGPVRLSRLLDYFGEPQKILGASERALMAVDGVGAKASAKISQWEEVVELDKELRRIDEFSCTILILSDENYPSLLRQIYDPPHVLYVKGQIKATDDCSIAMVGTRQSTLYGRQVAKKLAGQFAASGVTVVSGGARGIDSASHEGALDVEGRTIAVLGTGMDIIYPSENVSLFQRISEQGAVITQFPFGRKGSKYTFPIRNRIVAGMTQGTVVVEANRSSGALITANLAGECGRNVYAVPGRIDSPRSAGCHDLIRDGAQLCESAEDVLSEFTHLKAVNPELVKISMPTLSPVEQSVYEVLSHEEMQQDEIIRLSRLSSPQVSVALLQLEMKKLITQHPGRLFRRFR
tara:strand:- start:40 stop:1128 length:1089 start_codon:yes stop_codon:yes gene_type:complete